MHVWYSRPRLCEVLRHEMAKRLVREDVVLSVPADFEQKKVGAKGGTRTPTPCGARS
jgi:hypothetical protein